MAFFFTTVKFYFKKAVVLLTPVLAFGDFVFTILFALFLANTKDDARGAVTRAA